MIEGEDSLRNREDARRRLAARLAEYRDEDFEPVPDKKSIVCCSGAPSGIRTSAARPAWKGGGDR